MGSKNSIRFQSTTKVTRTTALTLHIWRQELYFSYITRKFSQNIFKNIITVKFEFKILSNASNACQNIF